MQSEQKMFEIANEISPCPNDEKDCTCVHWECPFCGGAGSLDMYKHNMPEYFSVTCHKHTFLVRRKMEAR